MNALLDYRRFLESKIRVAPALGALIQLVESFASSCRRVSTIDHSSQSWHSAFGEGRNCNRAFSNEHHLWLIDIWHVRPNFEIWQAIKCVAQQSLSFNRAAGTHDDVVGELNQGPLRILNISAKIRELLEGKHCHPALQLLAADKYFVASLDVIRGAAFCGLQKMSQKARSIALFAPDRLLRLFDLAFNCEPCKRRSRQGHYAGKHRSHEPEPIGPRTRRQPPRWSLAERSEDCGAKYCAEEQADADRSGNAQSFPHPEKLHSAVVSVERFYA